jgi:chromate transporter
MSSTLGEIARVFLRLGVTGFGGPAAHIALMREEIVQRRRWVTDREFLDLIAATNLIPGPNSTEMAIHLGASRGGWPGLFVAGACFIMPAVGIVLVLAWLYAQYGTTPQAAWLMYGIGPVIIAIIGQAIWGLARSGVRSVRWVVLALAAVVASLAGIHEIAVLGLAAAASVLTGLVRRHSATTVLLAVGAGLACTAAVTAAAAVETPVGFTLARLFWFFVKVGSVLFGSGYVLVAFLRADLVDRWGWLTDQQLLDAVAIGQIIPGPLFTTATFIGYQLGGVPAALIATVGIFAPAFFFVAITHPLVTRMRAWGPAGDLLDGLTAASLALMVVVTLQLALRTIVDPVTAALALGSLALLVFRRPNIVWLIAAGAVVGWTISQLKIDG